ncbi:MAG TPA: Spy/CpxP family protein refolding chaperone [Pyrinomonadaceae bacterium]|jgi:Spy/CpxP family protein refolding chaperone|nr:Spy/CpxP family protein refolding chaperone [Pyrinomonadaceae bacterium]
MKVTKTRLRIGAALVFVAALMMTVVGFAQQGGGERRGFGGPGRGGARGGGGLGPLERDLNLTDAQKAQVKQIRDSFEESTKSIREQLFNAGGTPFDGLKDGAFDEAAVRAAAQARANLHVELEVAQARMMSQVYALLTTEQKARLAERRQQFERRGHHAPGGETVDVPDGR